MTKQQHTNCRRNVTDTLLRMAEQPQNPQPRTVTEHTEYIRCQKKLLATHEKKEQMIAERQEQEFKQRYQEWKQQTEIEVNREVFCISARKSSVSCSE